MKEEYIQELKEKLSVYYDLIEDNDICKIACANAYFYLRAIGSRHMISKNITLWSVGEFEHCFIIDDQGELTSKKIEQIISRLEKVRDLIVAPGPEHKRTVVRGLIVTEDNPEKIRKQIRSYKNEVNYRWMFHGWSEISIIVINPSSGVYIHNSRKQTDIKYIEELFGIKEG